MLIHYIKNFCTYRTTNICTFREISKKRKKIASKSGMM